MSLFRRGTRSEADAAVTHVEMLKRINYGSAKVRVTYEVEPPDEASFEAVLEANVKMETLPQSGHRVRVSYDPNNHSRLEVLTPPGEETGAVTTPTIEIPFFDSHMPRYEGEIQRVQDRVSELEQDQPQPESTLDQLKQLGELRDTGVLTEAEFEAQKAKILGD